MSEWFNEELGEEYKQKFEEISESENRSMTGQLKTWIDENHPSTNGDA